MKDKKKKKKQDEQKQESLLHENPFAAVTEDCASAPAALNKSRYERSLSKDRQMNESFQIFQAVGESDCSAEQTTLQIVDIEESCEDEDEEPSGPCTLCTERQHFA
jgi:hypothetical protein